MQRGLAPQVGLEPTTPRLTAGSRRFAGVCGELLAVARASPTPTGSISCPPAARRRELLRVAASCGAKKARKRQSGSRRAGGASRRLRGPSCLRPRHAIGDTLPAFRNMSVYFLTGWFGRLANRASASACNAFKSASWALPGSVISCEVGPAPRSPPRPRRVCNAPSRRRPGRAGLA